MPTKKLERKLPKASEKFKDLFKKKREETEKKREDALREFFKKKGDKSAPMPTPKSKGEFQRRYGEVPKLPRKKKKDGVISFKELERMKKRKPKVMEAKKGGSAKFPDLSGDGKVTQKDILIGRGVIKRKKGGPVDKPSKKKSLAAKAAELIKKQLEKKKKILPFVTTGPKRVPRPKLPKPKKPGEITRVPRPKLPKPSDFNKPRTVTPAKRKRPKMMSTGGVAGRLAKRGYGKARS
jgi:hypothetical protein|tara:strand:- start:86 stop:796 length:711 start_codon:yes stop_codon:yes gene_type:complete